MSHGTIGGVVVPPYRKYKNNYKPIFVFPRLSRLCLQYIIRYTFSSYDSIIFTSINYSFRISASVATNVTTYEYRRADMAQRLQSRQVRYAVLPTIWRGLRLLNARFEMHRRGKKRRDAREVADSAGNCGGSQRQHPPQSAPFSHVFQFPAGMHNIVTVRVDAAAQGNNFFVGHHVALVNGLLQLLHRGKRIIAVIILILDVEPGTAVWFDKHGISCVFDLIRIIIKLNHKPPTLPAQYSALGD